MKEEYSFLLFVSGSGWTSRQAIANLQACVGAHLVGQFQLEVIDVLEAPERATTHGILVTPTLLKDRPPPTRRFLGDLGDRDTLLVGLGLLPG